MLEEGRGYFFAEALVGGTVDFAKPLVYTSTNQTVGLAMDHWQAVL